VNAIVGFGRHGEPTDGYPSALKEKRHLLSTRMEYIPGSTDGYPSALKEKHHLLSTRMEYIPRLDGCHSSALKQYSRSTYWQGIFHAKMAGGADSVEIRDSCHGINTDVPPLGSELASAGGGV